jgi:hypothetical protein
MRIYALRFLIAIMALIAILLIAAGISLHQMHLIRATGSESADDRRWLEQETDRRRREVAWGKIGFLATAGLDLTGIALLVAWERRKRLSSRSFKAQNPDAADKPAPQPAPTDSTGPMSG